MKRCLSIVLGNNCNISKTLIEDESYQLDKYIYDNFKDVCEIRSRFKQGIEQFLNANSNLISSIEKRNKKKYNGQIVILEVNEDGNLIQVRAIYKKDTDIIKKLLNDQYFMRDFVASNRSYFSDFIYDETRIKKPDYFYKRMMREFYSKIKKNKKFFEFCRSILRAAELGNKIACNNEEENINLDVNDYGSDSIDDELDNYEPDREFHPDLDDIIRGRYSPFDESITYYSDAPIEAEKQEYYSDEPIEGENQKVKVIERDPNQLSFFD